MKFIKNMLYLHWEELKMSKKPWLKMPSIYGKNEINSFDIPMSDNEIQQNFDNIKKILKGKSMIDYVGANTIYSYLFHFVADNFDTDNKKVIVNYLDPKLEPSELEEHMLSDYLVVSADLPEDIIENVSKSLTGKKQIIIGTLYKEDELVDNPGLHR